MMRYEKVLRGRAQGPCGDRQIPASLTLRLKDIGFFCNHILGDHHRFNYVSNYVINYVIIFFWCVSQGNEGYF
jgi:hypothetical protein